VFYKPIKKTVVDDHTGEEQRESFCVLRTYTVFCADQVSGAERFQVVEDGATGNAEPDFAPAEELIAATGADIRHGGERAFYAPVGDFIQLPITASGSAVLVPIIQRLATSWHIGVNPVSTMTGSNSGMRCVSLWPRSALAWLPPRSAFRMARAWRTTQPT